MDASFMNVSSQEAQGQPSSSPSISIEQVHSTIVAALSHDPGLRNPSEALIRSWEADAQPGFLSSLLQIVKLHQSIDPATRMLAAVIAKNAIGSSWRKTMGTREWSRVPDEEKASVKETTIALLLSDPIEHIAMQLSILLTNIARFDFPARSPDLLSYLISAASSSDLPPNSRLRALKSLKSILSGFSTKRFIIDPPSSAGIKGLTAGGMAELQQLSNQINNERDVFKKKISEAMPPLGEVFRLHAEGFLSCAQGWELHGPMAKAAAAAASELFALTPTTPLDGFPPGGEQLLSSIQTTCMMLQQASRQMDPQHQHLSAALPPGQKELWHEIGGKVSERCTKCIISALQHYPVPFASMVPAFLNLFVENALIALDASTVRAMRAKRRVLMVRFIAKTLLCPFYRPEWVKAPIPPYLSPVQKQQTEQYRAKAAVAHDALKKLTDLRIGPCGPLVEAIVSKYIALSPEELEEWRDDPESYARSMDVESGADADTPRPIGVGLMLCMLERGGEDVASALLVLTQRTHAISPPTEESILMREACYRCIGEGYNHIMPVVSFGSWFESELSPQLISRLPTFLQGTQQLSDSVLQSRALWLLGVCGHHLAINQWCNAYELVVKHIGSKDLVVALTSVSAALSLTSSIMDDQMVLEQYLNAMRPKGGMPNCNMLESLKLKETAVAVQEKGEEQMDGAMKEVKMKIEARTEALAGTMNEALQGCFALLDNRLHEVESMVRALQLVSVLVEVMGPRILPHLGAIASALPRIWSLASSQISSSSSSPSKTNQSNAEKGSSDMGGVVRLHSALIAVLTHIVGKLRSAAVNDPQIAGVVYPMLALGSSLHSAESECLIEESFRLWNNTIASLSTVSQPMLDLLPNLGRLLSRGKDNAAVFPIIESYLLLGAASALNPLSDSLKASLEKTVLNITQAVVQSLEPSIPSPSPNAMAPSGSGSGAGGQGRALSTETTNEAMAAAALVDVMIQLFPLETPSLLASTLKAMAALVAHPDIPIQGPSIKILNILEGFVEVLGRLLLIGPGLYSALLEHLPQGSSARFIDRWLHVASTRFLEEIVGVRSMAMLGRYRRRIATAALCSLVAADTCPDLYLDPKILTRAIGLSLQAVLDNLEYATDNAELDDLDFKRDLSEDFVMVKRIAVTRADPIRTMGIPDKVRGMLKTIATKAGGEQALVSLVEKYAPFRVVNQLRLVMQGADKLEEDSEDEDELVLPSRDNFK